jgi:predicted phosphodiesterase
MKIQLLSDLHIEHFRHGNAQVDSLAIHTEADVIVLAGDIHKGMDSLSAAQRVAQRAAKPVVWVPGNHEFYGKDLPEVLNAYRATPVDGVHVLLDTTTVIGGVRFAGGLLWTDFAIYEGSRRLPTAKDAMHRVSRALNDFNYIRSGKELFTVEESLDAHVATRTFLEGVAAQEFDGPTVIVTHHGPHPGSVHRRYAPDSRMLASSHRLPYENDDWLMTPGFVSNLEPLVERFDAWLHGHVHNSFDYRVGKCRVVANPRGYPRNGGITLDFENPEFEPLKLIEV